MIKILGSLIVIFAGIGFGFHKAAKEQKRLEQGIAIKRMLYLLQGEIRYGFTPLPEAVLKISTKTEKEYQPFLKKVAKQLETHSEESFAKVWQQTAEQKLKHDAFLATDAIGTEKLVSGEYNTNVFMFGDSDLRKLMADIQVEEQNHAEMLYKYKTANGMQ